MISLAYSQPLNTEFFKPYDFGIEALKLEKPEKPEKTDKTAVLETTERVTPEILLHVSIPSLSPSVNHTYGISKKREYYKNTEVKKWQQGVSCIFANQYGRPVPYRGLVGLYIILRTRNRRNMDCDNRIKSLQDCLTTGYVIRNDSQIWDLRVVRVLDKSIECDYTEVILFAL